MLRLLMIVSGTFEALFGLSALIAPNLLIAGLGTETTAAAGLLARIFGAAALGLGAAALLARDEVNTKGGIAAAFGLALYNVLAACFILWTAAIDHSGGAALWGAGLIHAVIGALFVYALAKARG
jgi:hypothetical protein